MEEALDTLGEGWGCTGRQWQGEPRSPPGHRGGSEVRAISAPTSDFCFIFFEPSIQQPRRPFLWIVPTLHIALLDDLIRPPQQRRRDRQAERLGGLEVDDQLEGGGLLH